MNFWGTGHNAPGSVKIPRVLAHEGSKWSFIFLRQSKPFTFTTPDLSLKLLYLLLEAIRGFYHRNRTAMTISRSFTP
jgi:hypothetical protein